MIFTLHLNKLNLFSSLQHPASQPASQSVVANISLEPSDIECLQTGEQISVGTLEVDVHVE